MKVDINQFKEIPGQFGEGLCIYGDMSEELKAWVEYHKIETEKPGKFTNFKFVGQDLTECFKDGKSYDFVDGFSPNLNKHLHLGHVSNFVIAKALQSMGIGDSFIANLGDTVTGAVEKDEALSSLLALWKKFGYKVNEIYFATQLVGDVHMGDGEGEYAGTKVFDVDGQKIVGKKSTGGYSYFYHDVILAEKLNGTVLYMTGFEQKEHFETLKKLYPGTNHMALGLVTVNGKKMSSSEGNVILLSEVMDTLKAQFGDDYLAWNVLSGYILKSDVDSIKDINMANIDNPRQSFGLYLSYTLAKLKSAGMKIGLKGDFNTFPMQFKALKAKINLQPRILFDGACDVAKKISSLYTSYHISGNEENQKMYQPLAEDMLLGMVKLGMFDVDKV